jgi:prevent-host-death family protein
MISMKTVGIFEAKTHFSALVTEVETGETIVVTRKGKPVARIVPIGERKRRDFGNGDARIVIADDFDDLPPELLEAFYGG